MAVIKQMKLQKFIENYHRKLIETPNKHSPERPHIFRTSESIGTLNSNDEFTTQRSFVVKDHSHHTSPNTHSIEHLRELCQSQSQRQSLVKDNGKLQQKIPDRSIGQDAGQLQSTNFMNLNKQHSKDRSFIKNKSTGVVQTFDGEISFSVGPENQDFFYDEAPSGLYEGCPTQPTKTIRQEQVQFFNRYAQLLAKIKCLQAENEILEQQAKRSKEIKNLLLEKQQALHSSISQLRQQVSQVIRQNIETQNKIKQMLLRHQIQKYRFFSSDKDMNIPLSHCLSEKQFGSRTHCSQTNY